MQGDVEAVAVAIAPHRFEAARHALCITVLAALADLGAPGHRVPGHLGPLDVRSRRHGGGKYSCARYERVRCDAIFTAVGAPRGLPAAKHSAYMGVCLEFSRISGRSTIFANMDRSRSRKNTSMSSIPAIFTIDPFLSPNRSSFLLSP